MRFKEMDATIPLSKQLEVPHGGPVVLINKFSVALEDRDALIAAWADDAAYFKHQPGFISAQLHRGIGESPVFLNYAVWESVDAFRAAFGRPEFRNRLAQYPASAVASPVRRCCLDAYAVDHLLGGTDDRVRNRGRTLSGGWDLAMGDWRSVHGGEEHAPGACEIKSTRRISDREDRR
jgi:heme-degrading monooxygenase HmoA